MKNPDTSSCWACAAVQGSIHPALLLALLGLLGMPMAHGKYSTGMHGGQQ